MKPSSLQAALACVVMLVLAPASRVAVGAPDAPTAPDGALPGTAVTYQGQLRKSGAPVNGACNASFRLYEAPTGGAQTGPTVTSTTLNVQAGLFTIALDFGATAHIGEARWLETSVGCGEAQTTLSPRTRLRPAPLALALPGLRTDQSGSVPNLVGGAVSNTVLAGNSGSLIGGGGSLANPNTIDGNLSVIAGGSRNSIGSADAFIGGGFSNTISSHEGVIGGGGNNSVSGDHGAIVGGINNQLAGNEAFLGGGSDNVAPGDYAVIPGGYRNRAAGSYSFAAGARAKANHANTFVFGDSTVSDFVSTGSGQFLIHAYGGVGINTNDPQNPLTVNGSLSGGATPDNHVVQIHNRFNDNNADVLALTIDYDTPAVSNNYITFFKSLTQSAGAIQGNGVGGVELAGPGNDYAEWLPKRDGRATILPGDVVGVSEGRVSRDTRGAPHVMIASGGPIVSGNDPGEGKRDGYAQIAFIGQALVRVRGPVRAGDLIVPSGKSDGYGSAVAPEKIMPEQLTQVAGQAWESAAGPGEHLVRAAVGLPSQNPVVQRLVERVASLEARLAALEQFMSR